MHGTARWSRKLPPCKQLASGVDERHSLRSPSYILDPVAGCDDSSPG
jgi:hypothetical protein